MKKIIISEDVQNYFLSLLYMIDSVAILFNCRTSIYVLTGAIAVFQRLSLIFISNCPYLQSLILYIPINKVLLVITEKQKIRSSNETGQIKTGGCLPLTSFSFI